MSSFFDQEFVADASQAQSEFTPIPENDYPLVIEKAEMKKSKAGDEMLSIQFKVDGTDYDNRKLFVNLNIGHSKPNVKAIAAKQLHALLTMCKIAKITCADDLVGQSLTAKVIVKKREDTGAMQNEVVLAVRKSDTTVASTTTTTSTQPSAVPPKKSGNGTWD